MILFQQRDPYCTINLHFLLASWMGNILKDPSVDTSSRQGLLMPGILWLNGSRPYGLGPCWSSHGKQKKRERQQPKVNRKQPSCSEPERYLQKTTCWTTTRQHKFSRRKQMSRVASPLKITMVVVSFFLMFTPTRGSFQIDWFNHQLDSEGTWDRGHGFFLPNEKSAFSSQYPSANVWA